MTSARGRLSSADHVRSPRTRSHRQLPFLCPKARTGDLLGLAAFLLLCSAFVMYTTSHLSLSEELVLDGPGPKFGHSAARILLSGKLERAIPSEDLAVIVPDNDGGQNLEKALLDNSLGIIGPIESTVPVAPLLLHGESNEYGQELEARENSAAGEFFETAAQRQERTAVENEKDPPGTKQIEQSVVGGKAQQGNVLDNLPPEAWEPCHWCRNRSSGGEVDPSKADASCPGATLSTSEQPYRVRGFIIPETTGGLNQIRRYICNAVGLAHLLHAALVLPQLQADVFWKDGGAFEDVFDVDFFIERLEGTVPVVRELPETVRGIPPLEIKVGRFDRPSHYVRFLLPVLQRRPVIKLRARFGGEYEPGFDHFEQARCRACFGALRFVNHVAQTGELLLSRMREKGRFAALHLRFEPDMVAFSRCEYPDLRPASVEILRNIRLSSRKFNKHKRVSAAELRRQGLCPLTPAETAKVFRALEIPSGLPIYLATGDFLEPEGLTSAYGNTFRKSDLLTRMELERYAGRANLLVALDFYVATRSDYFLATFYSNVEQMVVSDRTLSGRRHSLVLNRTAVAEAPPEELEWQGFKSMMVEAHLGPYVTVQAGQVPEKLPYCMCLKRTSEFLL